MGIVVVGVVLHKHPQPFAANLAGIEVRILLLQHHQQFIELPLPRVGIAADDDGAALPDIPQRLVDDHQLRVHAASDEAVPQRLVLKVVLHDGHRDPCGTAAGQLLLIVLVQVGNRPQKNGVYVRHGDDGQHFPLPVHRGLGHDLHTQAVLLGDILRHGMEVRALSVLQAGQQHQDVGAVSHRRRLSAERAPQIQIKKRPRMAIRHTPITTDSSRLCRLIFSTTDNPPSLML